MNLFPDICMSEWNSTQDIKIQRSTVAKAVVCCAPCPWMTVWICCSDSRLSLVLTQWSLTAKKAVVWQMADGLSCRFSHLQCGRWLLSHRLDCISNSFLLNFLCVLFSLFSLCVSDDCRAVCVCHTGSPVYELFGAPLLLSASRWGPALPLRCFWRYDFSRCSKRQACSEGFH